MKLVKGEKGRAGKQRLCHREVRQILVKYLTCLFNMSLQLHTHKSHQNESRKSHRLSDSQIVDDGSRQTHPDPPVPVKSDIGKP